MNSFMDWFWLMVWWFAFVMYLIVLFQIIGDLFRDRGLSGWWKALWLFLLIVVPFISALVYLIVRGKGMAERHAQRLTDAQASTDAYIRDVAGTQPTKQIADAKALLDSGAIDEQEYATLKARALA
ncbi:hypothetical protein [Luteimicrobium sp. DT211]|uniref:hypothetical protein n=1 Tax=Luteimicrobium sp. DT211 TaxID=3393412 RepID=UPI003CEF8773